MCPIAPRIFEIGHKNIGHIGHFLLDILDIFEKNFQIMCFLTYIITVQVFKGWLMFTFIHRCVPWVHSNKHYIYYLTIFNFQNGYIYEYFHRHSPGNNQSQNKNQKHLTTSKNSNENT